MRKIGYLLALSTLVLGAACSRIDANTSNNVPTTDAYAASVTGTNAAAGISATPADAVVQPSATSSMAGTMLYGNRAITEATFLTEAASSGIMELQLARLALERSGHPEVKDFAQMLVDHHTKANQELETLAAGMNLTLPATLLPDHQKLVDKLSKLTGAAFDDEYIDKVEDAHEQDIALYEVVSNGAQTTSIRASAIRSLPVLRLHEHQADKLEEKVNR